MSNSVAAGRRLARRAALFQAAAVLATALACLYLGPDAAVAALLGGGAMLVGTAVSAWRSLGGGVASARVVMVRMFVGLVLKWLVVIVALVLGLVVWRLPALPLLTGLLVALAASFVAAVARVPSTR